MDAFGIYFCFILFLFPKGRKYGRDDGRKNDGFYSWRAEKYAIMLHVAVTEEHKIDERIIKAKVQG